MKRLIMITGLLSLLIGPIIAQDITPPTDIIGVLMGLQIFLGSFPGVVALRFFLVPFVLGALNIQGKVLKYVVTVVVVTLVVVTAYFVSFGYLNGATWWTIPVNVTSIMLVQIGFFTMSFVKEIQEKIYEKFNPWMSEEDNSE